jgi:hypothetical protein
MKQKFIMNLLQIKQGEYLCRKYEFFHENFTYYPEKGDFGSVSDKRGPSDSIDIVIDKIYLESGKSTCNIS